MDDDRIRVQMGDVDDPYHKDSVHHDLHDNIHEGDGDGVAHQPERDMDDMKEVYWEEVVVDEAEDKWQVAGDEDAPQGEGVGDVDHGDVVDLYDDEVDQEDVSHGQHGVVEQQAEEELVGVPLVVLVTGQHHVYVVDDADENRDEQQVVDLLEAVMLIPVLDVVDVPSDRDLEVFYEVVYLSFHFHFQNLCLS